MAKKYTDEELSRILSAHEGGKLIRHGRPWCLSHGCVNQFAYNEPNRFVAYVKNETPAYWFDTNYVSNMDTEYFLNNLERLTNND